MQHFMHLTHYQQHIMELLDRAPLHLITYAIVKIIEASLLPKNLYQFRELNRFPIVLHRILKKSYLEFFELNLGTA